MSQTENDTALTPRKQKLLDIHSALHRAEDAIAKAIPATIAKYMTPERVIQIAWMAAQNEAIAKCDPRSIVVSVIDAAKLGLDFTPGLGHAYLVPYKGKCTLIVGYQGWVELCRRSGNISTVYAEVVHEADEFDFAFGDRPFITHKPSRDENPGKIIAVYGVAHLRDGGIQRVVMWARDVEKVRRSSASVKSGRRSPWDDWTEEMYKKTALRRLCKLLPKSAELARAIEMADESEPPVVVHGNGDQRDPQSLEDLIQDAEVEEDADDVETPPTEEP